MAYPRRQPRRQSTEEAVDSPTLSPPRPFFLDSANRSSGSSFDSSGEEDSPPEVPRKTSTHKKRSSMSYAPIDNAGTPTTPNWDPTQLYSESALLQRQLPTKPPPSSFAFPFQAYPGNPDPGTSIPGVSRRRSSVSDSDMHHDTDYHSLSNSGSLTDLRKPVAPFMVGGDASSSTGSLPRSSSSNSLYKGSAAANMMPAVPVAAAGTEPSTPVTAGNIPRNSSVHSFRAPFLAPSSRPNSSFWAPPSYTNSGVVASPTASTTALPYISKSKPPLPSTRLAAPLEKEDKPWLSKRERRGRLSYFITLFCIFLGLGGAAVLCWQGFESVHILDESKLCQVLDEQFSGPDLDENTWSRDVELGGFGNGEFQMTTQDPDNLFIQNGQLYIHPTLTSDKIGNIFDGANYTLAGCTTANKTACSAVGNAARGSVINPVQSARINTRSKVAIKFGKVEVRAKLPRGDWLWPAIWMLPQDDSVYGAWPAGGEIDILEARGNGIEYKAQGANFVRSSLNYGPMPAVFTQIFGWWSQKRAPYSDGFHTYTLEWDPSFMRISVDSKLHSMLEIGIGSGKKKSFWDKAGFPLTAQNGSSQVVVQNPYAFGSSAAPFDQKFYLIINLAVGGTSGWFPDGVGDKPWFDGSNGAMRDFAKAQDGWSGTWPQGADDRSFRVESVKMWEMCR